MAATPERFNPFVGSRHHRGDESYLPPSDVAVTFRSGQRSKWHAGQIH